MLDQVQQRETKRWVYYTQVHFQHSLHSIILPGISIMTITCLPYHLLATHPYSKSACYTPSPLKETRSMANALAGQKLSWKVPFLFLLKSVIVLFCLVFRDESVTLLPIHRQKKKWNSFFYFLSFCGGWAGMRESCLRVVEFILMLNSSMVQEALQELAQ